MNPLQEHVLAPSALRVSMPRFIAIDGLRTWLAWAVVGTHVIQQSFLNGGGRAWVQMDLGGGAVNIFIVISGFVITHLLIEQRKSYFAYLIPRFMRLFPGFFLSCALGGVAYWAAGRFGDPRWTIPMHGSAIATLAEFPVSHIIAHATLLHGLIPNNILPTSEYAFNNPGWSVSLEWQFYIVAPLAIRLANQRSGATLLVLFVIISSFFYHYALKEYWDRPSIIIGCAKFFLIGIACRYAAPSFAGRVKYIAAVGVGAGFTVAWIGSPSLAIWMLVYSFILKRPSEIGFVDQQYVRLLRLLLESRPALFFADRSYSTYLLHWPLLVLIGTAATHWGIRPGMELMLAMSSVFPITLLVQELVYQYIEIPGRRLGKHWASALGDQPFVEIATEGL